MKLIEKDRAAVAKTAGTFWLIVHERERERGRERRERKTEEKFPLIDGVCVYFLMCLSVCCVHTHHELLRVQGSHPQNQSGKSRVPLSLPLSLSLSHSFTSSSSFLSLSLCLSFSLSLSLRERAAHFVSLDTVRSKAIVAMFDTPLAVVMARGWRQQAGTPVERERERKKERERERERIHTVGFFFLFSPLTDVWRGWTVGDMWHCVLFAGHQDVVADKVREREREDGEKMERRWRERGSLNKSFTIFVCRSLFSSLSLSSYGVDIPACCLLQWGCRTPQ